MKKYVTSSERTDTHLVRCPKCGYTTDLEENIYCGSILCYNCDSSFYFIDSFHPDLALKYAKGELLSMLTSVNSEAGIYTIMERNLENYIS